MTAILHGLRSSLGVSSADQLSSPAAGAMDRLAGAHRWLVTTCGGESIHSDAGTTACSSVLEELQEALKRVGGPAAAADRRYRNCFSLNYRCLFIEDSRLYHRNVFKAAFQSRAPITVNGKEYKLSKETIQLAVNLTVNWNRLEELLSMWRAAESSTAGGSCGRGQLSPGRGEVLSVLCGLDQAWAAFEHAYVSELMQIEKLSRAKLVDAIHLASQLQRQQRPEDLVFSFDGRAAEMRQQLMACLCDMNAVANIRRKGRDDLRVDVLDCALATLRRCEAARRLHAGAAGGYQSSGAGGSSSSTSSGSSYSSCGMGKSAAEVLAKDVIESFHAMCVYLSELGKRGIELVDPHLCNNEGLVSRLEDIEQSWDVANQYLLRQGTMGALGDVVEQLSLLQKADGDFERMCEACDVELFLVLPRIVWLCFLSEPGKHMELMQLLLPHHFRAAEHVMDLSPGAMHDTFAMGEDLAALHESFRETKQMLVNLPGRDEHACWLILGGAAVRRDDPAGWELPEDAAEALRRLLHRLEPWSLELQRHCPQEWNDYSSVLLQCLTAAADASPSKSGYRFQDFRV
eukprot:TRINITY_DN25527_c0_g1_i1.p1 TRINITY_DN25527_c0_g1~~TRINITY_DN25527_c0_g1_i1.p1  ORF type:complete len:573 (+),score=117.62 TRINITY_DN25527_c0_g1_i1:113-1831(+)